MATVGDIRDMLEDLDDDMEVRIAIQPSYPFGHHIDANISAFSKDGSIFYIAEAGQAEYLPEEVATELGW